MKPRPPQLILMKLICCMALVAARHAFGLGADYRNDQPVIETSSWPKGMERLVNVTNRVHGFFINSADTFFFSGSATNLSAFLADYAKISGIEKHRLILHTGVGEAKSPWEMEGRAAEWKLYGCPKEWHDRATAQEKGPTNPTPKANNGAGYILEVHVWTGGRIPIDQVSVPKNVEVTRDKNP